MFDDFNITKYKLTQYPSDISLKTLNEIKKLQVQKINVPYADKYDDVHGSFKRLFINKKRQYP